MSIEIYVLSDRRLSSMAEWQRAVAQEGFDLTFDETAVFAELSGFLPVRMKGKATGFECDHWDPNDIIDSYAEINFSHRWSYALAFRWGASFDEHSAAWMAAGAYARATDGIVFNPELSEQRTADEAADVVRELEASPVTEAVVLDFIRKAGLIP